jgi:sec-independent protein translocase protein TatC
VFLIFLFVAIASPSPDAGSMLLMAGPLVALYVITVFICLFNDRRRGRRRQDDPIFGMADDEAAPLDDAGPLDDGDSVGASNGIARPAEITRPSPIDRSFDDDAT